MSVLLKVARNVFALYVKNKIDHRRIRHALPPAFAYEVIEKLLQNEADTDEQIENENFALKKTCQIVKGASHSQ